MSPLLLRHVEEDDHSGMGRRILFQPGDHQVLLLSTMILKVRVAGVARGWPIAAQDVVCRHSGLVVEEGVDERTCSIAEEDEAKAQDP